MPRTGPQRYPGASTAYWHQDTHPGTPMDVNVVVLHTTEGRSLPSYGGGSSAPNLTAVPDFGAKKLRWFQHFDIETSSRALANAAGGVETNTLNVVQVELVGTCDPVTHRKWGAAPHVYWPDAPDWALQEVARFLLWMHEEHGVPLVGPAKWPAYPASYANGGGQRMTGAQWQAFSGVCGHMHVPENDHGDPGAIDFIRLLAYATGTNEEDDMTLTDAEIQKIAKAVDVEVWGHRFTSPTAPAGTDPTREAGDFLRYGDAKHAALMAAIADLKATEAAQSATIAELVKAVAALAANPAAIDVDALVARITGAIETRLENVEVRLDVTP